MDDPVLHSSLEFNSIRIGGHVHFHRRRMDSGPKGCANEDSGIVENGIDISYEFEIRSKIEFSSKFQTHNSELEADMAEEVYRKLAKHLSSLGMGYPEKEELIDILRENFTPQEAEVALAIPADRIPFKPASIDEISTHIKLPKKKLGSILSNLAHRGLLFSKKRKDGKTGYALQQFGYGFPQTFFWKGVETPHARRMADLIIRYSRSEQLYEAYGKTKTKALRYIPATPSIEPEQHAVFPFEMMEGVIHFLETNGDGDPHLLCTSWVTPTSNFPTSSWKFRNSGHYVRSECSWG